MPRCVLSGVSRLIRDGPWSHSVSFYRMRLTPVTVYKNNNTSLIRRFRTAEKFHIKTIKIEKLKWKLTDQITVYILLKVIWKIRFNFKQ